MRFLRILPAVWAMISCAFSSVTRKVALGSSSLTVPGNSSSSSLAIRPLKTGDLYSNTARATRESWREPWLRSGCITHSPPKRRWRPEPAANRFGQAVANLAIGGQPRLARAVDQGGVVGRPVLDVDG